MPLIDRLLAEVETPIEVDTFGVYRSRFLYRDRIGCLPQGTCPGGGQTLIGISTLEGLAFNLLLQRADLSYSGCGTKLYRPLQMGGSGMYTIQRTGRWEWRNGGKIKGRNETIHLVGDGGEKLPASWKN